MHRMSEKGQAQTEYMIILMVVVLIVLGALIALGVVAYNNWDHIISSLPF